MADKAALTYRVVGGDVLIEDMFNKRGWVYAEDPYVLVFSGGDDVTPELYGCKPHIRTRNNTRRDAFEMWEFHKALNKKKIGICRGGQFLNVMSGGGMYQHIEGHTESHTCKDHYSGKQYLVTSTHHQMMKPGGGAKIIGTTQGQAKRVEDEMGNKIDFGQNYDIEVLSYHNTYSICFQPHPEYGIKSCEDFFWHTMENVWGIQTKPTPVKEKKKGILEQAAEEMVVGDIRNIDWDAIERQDDINHIGLED
jgi:hypothetical protein